MLTKNYQMGLMKILFIAFILHSFFLTVLVNFNNYSGENLLLIK